MCTWTIDELIPSQTRDGCFARESDEVSIAGLVVKVCVPRGKTCACRAAKHALLENVGCGAWQHGAACAKSHCSFPSKTDQSYFEALIHHMNTSTQSSLMTTPISSRERSCPPEMVRSHAQHLHHTPTSPSRFVDAAKHRPCDTTMEPIQPIPFPSW